MTNPNDSLWHKVPLSHIQIYPEWYLAAFQGNGLNAHNISDSQRQMPGIFQFKDGAQMKAMVFGRVEQGNFYYKLELNPL